MTIKHVLGSTINFVVVSKVNYNSSADQLYSGQKKVQSITLRKVDTVLDMNGVNSSMVQMTLHLYRAKYF